jgi:HNH endonuclease
MERIEKCKFAINLGFFYDSDSGNIITPRGNILRKKTQNGYLMLCFRDKHKKLFYLYAHQFAYYSKYRKIVLCIDHINGDKTDNKILNLRSVTKSQNAMNMKNVKGYYYNITSKRFVAFIMINYKSKQLGSFLKEEDARNCYLENKKKYHIIN